MRDLDSVGRVRCRFYWIEIAPDLINRDLQLRVPTWVTRHIESLILELALCTIHPIGFGIGPDKADDLRAASFSLDISIKVDSMARIIAAILIITVSILIFYS